MGSLECDVLPAGEKAELKPFTLRRLGDFFQKSPEVFRIWGKTLVPEENGLNTIGLAIFSFQSTKQLRGFSTTQRKPGPSEFSYIFPHDFKSLPLYPIRFPRSALTEIKKERRKGRGRKSTRLGERETVLVLVYFKQILPRKSSTITCTLEECVWRGECEGVGWNPKKPNSWKAVLTTAFLRAGSTQVALLRLKQTTLPWEWVCTHTGVHIPGSKKEKKREKSSPSKPTK